jgi:hypothetical protein
VGDYWEIMAGGWFNAAGTIPNFFTIGTDGWWNTAVGGIVAAVVTAVIFPIFILRGR